jgi:hypothetical protein
MIYGITCRTMAVLLMLIALASVVYAQNVVFTLTGSRCSVFNTTATLSATWNDPQRQCTNTYNDSWNFVDTTYHLWGAGCQSQQTMEVSWDTSTCSCTKYRTVGIQAGITSILKASDCVTDKSNEYWEHTSCTP